MKKEISIKVLERLISFLNDFKIPFYISGGTLLGYIRDGDIINGDTDIDLCTYVPYITIIYQLKSKLSDYQLEISREIKGDKLLKSKKQILGNQVYNTNIRYPNTVKYLWRISFNGTNEGESKDDDIDEFRWIDVYGKQWFPLVKSVPFHGFFINIPKDSESYLDFVYQDWKTPISRKIFKRPLSAQPIFVCTALYFSKYGIKNRDNKYLYIDEKVCENFIKINHFFIFRFVKNIVMPTLLLL